MGKFVFSNFVGRDPLENSYAEGNIGDVSIRKSDVPYTGVMVRVYAWVDHDTGEPVIKVHTFEGDYDVEFYHHGKKCNPPQPKSDYVPSKHYEKPGSRSLIERTIMEFDDLVRVTDSPDGSWFLVYVLCPYCHTVHEVQVVEHTISVSERCDHLVTVSSEMCLFEKVVS